MYVDRFRYGENADQLTVGWQSLLRELLSKLRKAPELIEVLQPILRAHNALSDVQSRRIFRDLLTYRYISPRLTRLANDRAKFEKLESAMSAAIDYEFLKYPLQNSLNESLRLWSVGYKDRSLKVITSKYGLYWMLHSDQYYLSRDGIFVGPQTGDVVFDCGCHVGDVSLRFAVDVGVNGQVFGFDPDPQHIAISRENALRNGLGEKMTFMTCGVSDRVGEKHAEEERGPSATINAGRILKASDASTSIDVFCEQHELETVNYIKMDIEGSEMRALRGAERTIQRFRPKLAICVYHWPADLWEITNYIADRYRFYYLFLGHHSLHAEETVLYASVGPSVKS